MMMHGLANVELIFSFLCPMIINPLKPELNPICYLLALLGARHFLHFSRIRVKVLNLNDHLLVYGERGAILINVSFASPCLIIYFK